MFMGWVLQSRSFHRHHHTLPVAFWFWMHQPFVSAHIQCIRMWNRIEALSHVYIAIGWNCPNSNGTTAFVNCPKKTKAICKQFTYEMMTNALIDLKTKHPWSRAQWMHSAHWPGSYIARTINCVSKKLRARLCVSTRATEDREMNEGIYDSNNNFYWLNFYSI